MPGHDAASPQPALSPLDPRVRALWWAVAALVAVPVVVAAAVVDLLAPLPGPAGLLTATAVVLPGGLAAVVPALRYRRWRYALRDEDLWIQRGVLWVTVTVIPLRRLQFVDTQQGPLDRLFGLAQLVVHTAAVGTSGQLPGLDAVEAERLRERLAATSADAAV